MDISRLLTMLAFLDFMSLNPNTDLAVSLYVIAATWVEPSPIEKEGSNFCAKLRAFIKFVGPTLAESSRTNSKSTFSLQSALDRVDNSK